jgi:outer membrane protein assembly factor BamB
VTLADELIALDVASGTPLWSFPTGEPNPDFLLNSAPAVSGGRVFFGGLDGSVHAVEVASGAPVWKRALGARVSTSILLAEGSLYAGTADGQLHRLDAATGEPVASLRTEEPPGGRLTAAGRCLLSFLGARAISCVELSLEGFRWTRRTEKDWTSSRPYVWRGYALAADSGSLVALRLTDGEPVWSVSLPGTVRGIGIGEDALFAGTLQGAVHAYPLPALP